MGGIIYESLREMANVNIIIKTIVKKRNCKY